MMFDHIILNIPLDKTEAIKFLVEEYEKLSGSCGDYELLQFYVLLKNICDEFNVGIGMPDADTEDVVVRTKHYCDYFMKQAKIKAAIAEVDGKYKARIAGAVIPDDKRASIQRLIDKLRDMVLNSELFTDEHRQRVLEKLEKLQGELHRRITNFDKLLSGMVRFGKALGLSAVEAKPFTDTVGEMYGIVHDSDPELRQLPACAGGDVLSLPQGEPE